MDEKERRRLSQLMEPGQAISKKSYVFEGKRQYNNVRKYKVTYTDELTFAALMGMLKDALLPKGKKTPRARHPINYRPALFKLLWVAIAIGVVGFLALLLLSALAPKGQSVAPPAPSYEMNYTYKFINTEMISYGQYLRAYATISLNGTGINGTSVGMRLYSEQIPREIVLLKSRKDKLDMFDDFKASLGKSLSESGLSVREMDITQLMHSPDNSPMILVVPTGRVPSSFLGLDDPNFDLSNLMGNGDVIIYLGYKFTSGAIYENGNLTGVSEVTGPISKLKLTFKDIPIRRLKDGFRMEKADYSVTGQGMAQLYHDGISIVKGPKSGYLVVFPNAIKDGWASGADAAYDVYSVVRELTWLAPQATADPITIGNPDVRKPISAVETLFSSTYKQRENLTAQFLISSFGFDARKDTKIEYVYFPIVARGTLSHADWILPTAICNKTDEDKCDLYMTIDFNETTSRDVPMWIVAYRDGNKVSETYIDIKKTQLPGDKYSYTVNLPNGDYVLKIQDETGYVYAQSYLHVPKIELVEEFLDFAHGSFHFRVTGDGKKLPENFDVKNVYISLDGQQNRSMSSKLDGDDKNHRIVYNFNGVVPEGDHTISITVGNETQVIKRGYFKRREFWENPLYQGALVIVIVLFAIGMIIKRPESAVFQIDVPDFPPLSKTKVPVTREQACGIFELVNSDYRWRHMPLKHGEIKNGFRKLSYKGRPILVSDYNLERVLDQLIEERLVKSSMEFYGLSSWEEESGKPLAYLAVFRSLRDSFLNMSLHFTDLGERPDCDMVVSGHDKYYIHIYTSEETVPRALATLSKGRTVIVFKDNDSVEAFMRDLSSTNKSMIAAKLYIDSESLFVATPGDMDRIIK